MTTSVWRWLRKQTGSAKQPAKKVLHGVWPTQVEQVSTENPFRKENYDKIATVGINTSATAENPCSTSDGSTDLAGTPKPELSILNRLRPRPGVHLSRSAPERQQSGQRRAIS